jgi:hypothetical protein
MSHVKIAWDYPVDWYGTGDPTAYYPGDAYVDIISCDIYFAEAFNGAATSAAAWNLFQSGTSSSNYTLQTWATFAKLHNKPMASFEWGDTYGDGYCITQFSKFIKANNFVTHCWWNSSDSYGSGANSILQKSPAAQAAFVAAWGNQAYGGTYWPVHIPIPPINANSSNSLAGF